MGQQLNKVIKRRRRAAYLERRNAKLAARALKLPPKKKAAPKKKAEPKLKKAAEPAVAAVAEAGSEAAAE